MAPPQGLIFWGGVADMLSGRFTFTPGVTPSVCTLLIPPQDPRSIFGAGPLGITFGGRRMVFPGCRLDSIAAVTAPDGSTVWELRILDRRWVWQETGRVSGFYNARDGSKIRKGTEKDPRQLAAICLKALGENGFDVSALPRNPRPEVDWDYTRPAEALAAICDQFGCMVCLGLDNRVKIARRGHGARLPTADIIDGSSVSDPPDPPGRLVVVGGRTRYQHDFKLEAVGLEADGAIVPIDRLSYVPKWRGWKTWAFCDAQHFTSVADVKKRGLAIKSVFRWYRIKPPFRLPGVDDRVNDLDRILPLENEQVERWDQDGVDQARPPWVYGRFWRGNDGHKDGEEEKKPDVENNPRGFYTDGFSLDTERGIVVFSQPVIRLKDDPSVILGHRTYPADLYLRVAVNLRDAGTLGWVREEFERAPPSRSPVPAAKQYMVREDVTRELVDYTGRSQGAAPADNLQDATKIAEYYLSAAALQYTPRQSGAASYAGFLPISPDGAIVQVTWTVDGQGRATTRASRNREEANLAPTYQEARFLSKIARQLDEQARPGRSRRDNNNKRRAPR